MFARVVDWPLTLFALGLRLHAKVVGRGRCRGCARTLVGPWENALGRNDRIIKRAPAPTEMAMVAISYSPTSSRKPSSNLVFKPRSITDQRWGTKASLDPINSE